MWDGWHRIEVEGELRAPLLVAHGLVEDGYVAAALAYLDALADVHPEASPLLEALGVLHLRLGFPRAAERDFERALSGSGSRAGLWYALGRVRLALALPAAAHESLHRAAELGEDGYPLHRDLARSQRRLGHRPEALIEYEAALAREGAPRAELLVEAATLILDDPAAHFDPAVWDRAFAMLDEAGLLDPRSPRICFVRGLLHERRGNPAGAIAAYEAALERDPHCLSSLTNLALVAHRANDEPRLHDAVRRALPLERDRRRRALLEDLLATPSGALAARE